MATHNKFCRNMIYFANMENNSVVLESEILSTKVVCGSFTICYAIV
jgi:hypothetical protein